MNTLCDTFGGRGEELSALGDRLASLCLVAILATYVGRALWPNRHFLWVQFQRGLARFASG